MRRISAKAAKVSQKRNSETEEEREQESEVLNQKFDS